MDKQDTSIGAIHVFTLFCALATRPDLLDAYLAGKPLVEGRFISKVLEQCRPVVKQHKAWLKAIHEVYDDIRKVTEYTDPNCPKDAVILAMLQIGENREIIGEMVRDLESRKKQ